MSLHKEDYVATGNKVKDFLAAHPLLLGILIGFISGAAFMATRLNG
jgi:hypothetical protein